MITECVGINNTGLPDVEDISQSNVVSLSGFISLYLNISKFS